jgi:hypothetical protein
MKQTRNIISLSLIFLLTIYLALFLFPQVIFANKLDYKSFIVYSHYKLDKNIFAILDSVENLVSKSELYNDRCDQNRIFICNSFLEYSFLALTQLHAFACINPLTNNIVLSTCNIVHNRIERNGDDNNIRTLCGTIAHEFTHTLIENKIGLFKNMHLETWKKEGYCDFIAKESSYNFTAGMQSLCANQNTSSPSFRYFKYRLYIDYLIKDRHLSFNEIINRNFVLSTLDTALKKKYCP